MPWFVIQGWNQLQNTNQVTFISDAAKGLSEAFTKKNPKQANKKKFNGKHKDRNILILN